MNPVRSGEPIVERFGWRFQMRDKVIQTENEYDKDVFNGDAGIVERVDLVEQQVAYFAIRSSKRIGLANRDAVNQSPEIGQNGGQGKSHCRIEQRGCL